MVATAALHGIRYEELLSNLPYGKVLPSAIYLHRETKACKTGAVGKLLGSLVNSFGIGDEFNVVKFRTNAPRISFLCYPDFFENPHPPLEDRDIDEDAGLVLGAVQSVQVKARYRRGANLVRHLGRGDKVAFDP